MHYASIFNLQKQAHANVSDNGISAPKSMFTGRLTAVFVVLVLVAKAIPDVRYPATLLEHVRGDDVVVHTQRFRVDTGEIRAVVII